MNWKVFSRYKSKVKYKLYDWADKVINSICFIGRDVDSDPVFSLFSFIHFVKGPKRIFLKFGHYDVYPFTKKWTPTYDFAIELNSIFKQLEKTRIAYITSPSSQSLSDYLNTVERIYSLLKM